jgi:hypothetical protein
VRKPSFAPGASREADHREARRQQAVLGEAHQRRHQLALGEVAGGAEDHSAHELRAVFEQILPLGISFTIVGMIWHAHYLFFRRYGLRDGWSAFLNGVLMFLVLLFAYPMKLLFGMLCEALFGFGSRVPIREIFDAEFPLLIVYSLGFAAIYLVIALLYRHAWAQRDRLALDEFECAITRQYHQSSWILAGFGLLSATLAAVLPDRLQGIAGWLYFGIGPAMGVHAWRWGVRRARLRAAHPGSAVA